MVAAELIRPNIKGGITQGTTATITTALTGAMGTIATEVIDALIAILPIALPVLGAMLTVAVGIKLFRRLTNKG